MRTHGKKYRGVKGKTESRIYGLDEAAKFLKENKVSKFDETVELAFRLGVDPKKTDLSVRGTVSLPHGTGKTVRVAVFAVGDHAESAKKAGADFVGMEDLIEKVKGGWVDFDVAIASPVAMNELRKLGKILGPRGLMPNPKTGTVTEDTGAAVSQYKKGKVEFKMDKQGNVHMPVAKLSFDVVKIVENIQTALNAVLAAKPPALKAEYIKTCTVTSTMGVGLRISMPSHEE